MDIKDMIGKAVVSLDEAEKVGRVADVVVDPAQLRVVGVRVAEDGSSYLLPFERITKVGPDAITIETVQSINQGPDAGRLGQLPGMNDLTAMKVVDESGTYQGTIGAVHADPASGELTTIDVAKGGVLGLAVERDSLAVASIRSVGHDVVTVRSTAASASAASPSDRGQTAEDHRTRPS